MRILYVSHNPPIPMHNGGAQRTNLIYRALRAIGKVDLVIVSTDPVTNREELQRDYGLVADFVWQRPGDLPPFRWFLRWKRELVHKAAQTLMPRAWDYRPDPVIAKEVRLVAERHYDVVVGRYLRPTIKSGVVGLGPRWCSDVDDLDTQVFLSRLNVPGRPAWERFINRWHYRQIQKIVPGELRKFDLVWVTNDDEEGAGEGSKTSPPKRTCRTSRCSRQTTQSTKQRPCRPSRRSGPRRPFFSWAISGCCPTSKGSSTSSSTCGRGSTPPGRTPCSGSLAPG